LTANQRLTRVGVSTLIMAVRNLDKAERAKEELLASTGHDPDCIQVWHLDMDSYGSIRAFAYRAASEHACLDGVLANAGLTIGTFSTSGGEEGGVGGHERTANVNVIGTLLLGLLLLPTMRASARRTGWPFRFVIPNSALHYLAPLRTLQDCLARGDDRAAFDANSFYGRYSLSKLLVLYAVRELAAQCDASAASASRAGDGGPRRLFIFNTPNPSYCVSGLERETGNSLSVRTFQKLLARTTEEGSRTLYHGLFAGDESNGQ
ncbi:uncharacterized protein P884DRAFT_307907, partial [Thermothelomyces heterothallicus CBS 202.75]|uniref:uncharacterized protein n=1 Tax=Thermothelomyces heterothallicus CBS 202.75 TaxID=1149848 RepID=UPI003742C010